MHRIIQFSVENNVDNVIVRKVELNQMRRHDGHCQQVHILFINKIVNSGLILNVFAWIVDEVEATSIRFL
jgi:hypothetical protein